MVGRVRGNKLNFNLGLVRIVNREYPDQTASLEAV